MIVITPREESNTFFEWFYICWHMEMSDNFSYWYDRQKRLESVLLEQGYDSHSFFRMLCVSHDIIYDRE
jgi:hypothetical protein